MKQPTKISIDTGTFIRATLVVAAAILIFLVRDILLILLVAVVIASAASPAVEFFTRYKIPRAASAGIVYALTITVFTVFFYLFVPIFVNEVSGFLSTLPEYSAELSEGAGVDAEDVTAPSLDEVVASARATLGNFSDSIFGTIATVFGGVFNLILILTISFYLSIQKNGVGRFLSYVTPVQHTDYVASLWERSQRKIGKWFQGMMVSSLAVGFLVYLGLLILGVPYAFFFALLSALLNFIPIVGPTLSAIPAVIVGLVEGGIILGALVVALYIVIQSVEGNVLFPLVVGKAVGVSPIAIILAVGVGAKVAGFLGVILAVPVSAVMLEFIADMRERNKDKKPENDKGDKHLIAQANE